MASWVAYVQQRATQLFRAYAVAGTTHLSREERNAVMFFATVMPITVVSFLGWVIFYLSYDASTYWPAALVSASYAVVLFAPFIAKKNRFVAEIGVILFTCATFSVLSYMLGTAAGLHVSLLLVATFGVVEAGTKRPPMILFAIGVPVAVYVVLPFLFPLPQVIVGAAPDVLATMSEVNLWNIIVVLLICVLIVLRRAEAAEDDLVLEFGRSEALLANLLPQEVARRLKQAPGEIIADEIPAVTFLFADIVGFTPRVARMTPEELVRFLNLIFSQFDVLCAKHGLEKIKTVGDAYMIAGGLPVARVDHAQAVALMALDMQEAALNLSKSMGEDITLRIGLHSGPAVAGVIGTRKVFYDAWGDTVNVAARMEATAKPGMIQITQEVRDALGDGFRVEPRGAVDIKGKGVLETFWLVGQAS